MNVIKLAIGVEPHARAHHSLDRDDSLVNVPLPGVRGNQRRIIPCNAIKRPIRGGDMHIIVRTSCRKGRGLVPRPPIAPVNIRGVVVGWLQSWLVKEDGLRTKSGKNQYTIEQYLLPF